MSRLAKIGIPLVILSAAAYTLVAPRVSAAAGKATSQTDSPRSGNPAAAKTTTGESKPSTNSPVGQEESTEHKLRVTRAELERLQATIYSNNPALRAVEGYREAIQRLGLNQAAVTEDFSRFFAVPDPVDSKKRSQAYMKAFNSMVPIVISDLCAQETNLIGLFKATSAPLVTGEAGWRLLTASDGGDSSAIIPPPEERTFERFLEEANKRREQISKSVRQIGDGAGMTTDILEAIRIDAGRRLLASAAGTYKEVVPPPELVALRQEPPPPGVAYLSRTCCSTDSRFPKAGRFVRRADPRTSAQPCV